MRDSHTGANSLPHRCRCGRAVFGNDHTEAASSGSSRVARSDVKHIEAVARLDGLFSCLQLTVSRAPCHSQLRQQYVSREKAGYEGRERRRFPMIARWDDREFSRRLLAGSPDLHQRTAA
jgi:hypothetical protein